MRAEPRLRGVDVVALVLLVFGGFFAFLGWLVGVVLLWTSDRWTTGEKLLGTLLFPFGYAGVVLAATMSFGFTLPGWLGYPIFAVIVLAPIFSLYVLLKNAWPGRSAH